MKNYKTQYLDYYGYNLNDYISCEVCKNPAVDIHHIFARQMGGSLSWDFPLNLIALCRKCHNKYGDKKHYYTFLLEIKHININNILIEEFLNSTEDYLIYDNQKIPRKYISYLPIFQ